MGCDRVSSRVRGDLKLEAHERRETRQVSPAHHPICRSHSEFMFQSMWISRYVCKLLDGRGGDSESRETNLTIGFPVVFPPRSVAHVSATENPRPAVWGCTMLIGLGEILSSYNVTPWLPYLKPQAASRVTTEPWLSDDTDMLVLYTPLRASESLHCLFRSCDWVSQ